jgi:hypothetical protein
MCINLSTRTIRLRSCIYPNQTAFAEAPCGFPVHPRPLRHCSCWSAYCSCSLLSLHTHVRVCRRNLRCNQGDLRTLLVIITIWQAAAIKPRHRRPCAMRTANRTANRWIVLCIPMSCHSWRPNLSHPSSIPSSIVEPLPWSTMTVRCCAPPRRLRQFDTAVSESDAPARAMASPSRRRA